MPSTREDSPLVLKSPGYIDEFALSMLAFEQHCLSYHIYLCIPVDEKQIKQSRTLLRLLEAMEIMATKLLSYQPRGSSKRPVPREIFFSFAFNSSSERSHHSECYSDS